MTEYQKVHVVNMVEIPIVERKSGSDCSLTDGDVNRVLTLSNPSLSSKEIVYLDGVALTLTAQYAVTHQAANSTITILIPVWDNQPILILYFI